MNTWRSGEGGAQTAKWITIPEGYTSKQIASDLAAHGLGAADAFEQTFASEHLILDGTRTVNLEGYLFPDTYLVPVQTTPHAVAALLTGQFRSELPADAASKAKALRFTVPQIITVASLIEREAKADDERALMAGMYYNRMKGGMPLEVDATIEYIFPEHHTEITRADLRIDSPYNTYLHEGLPPTPIANPGAHRSSLPSSPTVRLPVTTFTAATATMLSLERSPNTMRTSSGILR